jgi:L-malate glycosyltransferase
MKIGVCGPVNLQILDWEKKPDLLPPTNSFPLTSHLVNGLLKRGFEVVVYTNSSAIKEPLVYSDNRLKVCIAREKPKPGRRMFQFEVNDLKQLIVAHPCDMISAWWTYEFAWAALRSKIPAVVSLHDVAHIILWNHRDLFRVVRWIMNEIVVRKATYLIANSAYTFNLLSNRLKRKTQTINNFYPANLKELVPQYAEKEHYIITVAQGFTKRKNIHTALHAFKKVRQQYPTLEYYLIGVGTEENGEAHQYCKANGLTDGVRFMGMMNYNELIVLVAKAKIMIHPAVEESFGMVILEAMVAGTAVIAGKSSGFVPDLLDYGRAGMLCDINSDSEIASAICKLIADRSLRESYTSHACRFAEANFSEDIIIEQHLDYYSKALGKKLEPVALPKFEMQEAIAGKGQHG